MIEAFLVQPTLVGTDLATACSTWGRPEKARLQAGACGGGVPAVDFGMITRIAQRVGDGVSSPWLRHLSPVTYWRRASMKRASRADTTGAEAAPWPLGPPDIATALHTGEARVAQVGIERALPQRDHSQFQRQGAFQYGKPHFCVVLARSRTVDGDCARAQQVWRQAKLNLGVASMNSHGAIRASSGGSASGGKAENADRHCNPGWISSIWCRGQPRNRVVR